MCKLLIWNNCLKYKNSNNNTNKKIKTKQKDGRKKYIKKFRKRKIKELEQDEQVIRTISKDKNISN